jgi:alkylhydroperoxidase/carboxymuconolactone decarboxylase family protein YurZ
MTASEIDPSLDLFGEFGKLTKGTTKHIAAMRQDVIFAEGAVPARMKALAAVLWAISARCEPYYVRQAVKLGATEAELGEFLAIASVMGGCVGEMWALKAFKAYKDAIAGDTAPVAEPSCCP